MDTAPRARQRHEPESAVGWTIALVVALLLLVAIYLLWRSGYFGPPLG